MNKKSYVLTDAVEPPRPTLRKKGGITFSRSLRLVCTIIRKQKQLYQQKFIQFHKKNNAHGKT